MNYYLMKRSALLLLFALLTHIAHAQTLTLATYQYADNNRIANILPLAQHLKAKTGYEVEAKSYPTVHLLIKAIENNEVDIALINTFGYLLLETSPANLPMEPVLALQVQEGAQDNYKTAIIAPYNSPVSSLPQIKNHAPHTRLMLVNVGSTSGNLVPRLALSNAGLPDAEASFKGVVYGTTHRATIDSVAEGKVGLAAVGSSAYFSFIGKAENARKIKLVWLSSEIPLGPVLVNKRIPASVKNTLISELLQLEKTNPEALLSVKNGWSEAKQAEKFIQIDSSYYSSFKKELGEAVYLQKILKQFIF
jgi:phosphate/phosphite/phosphonate ABC transporter binding protein